MSLLKIINKHFLDIRQGGSLVLFRKIKTLFLYQVNFSKLILNSVWAIPTVIIIRCLKPWVLIRIGTISSDRIGHFVPDVSLRWAEFKGKLTNHIDLYWLPNHTCNNQWETMVRRNFNVAWFFYYLYKWNKLFPGGLKHHIPHNTSRFRDTGGLIAKTGAHLEFLQEEENKAKNWMKKQGWKDKDPFVCLLVRDSSFLDSGDNQGKWNYHNYRDTSLENYIPAIEWLADQGIWVFRMGKIMKKPLLTNHPHIIDYSFHEDKCDFLDIWLFARCTLCISTGTGPDMISQIYQRPILMLNYIPLRGIWTWCNITTYPKHLFWGNSSKELSLIEQLNKYPFVMSQDYQKAKIRIVDLNEEEILEAVMEKWSMLKGTWEPQPGDKERQEEFWRQLKTCKEYKSEIFNSPAFSKQFGFIHPNARFGYSFLRRNPKFLEIKDSSR